VPPREITSRAIRYLEMFDMLRFQDRLAGRLSGGMKQKLALVCALVPEPHVLLLDEPTTGVDPVSRREFWDVLAHLAGDGLTVVVATPYLDEAERCHRVALMYHGVLHQIGTPADLKQSISSQRLELRTPDLAIAEQLLDGEARETVGIKDVQRFGDRLDVLVADPVVARSAIETLFRSKGWPSRTFRWANRHSRTRSSLRCEPWEKTPDRKPFPATMTTEHLRGRIAIGARTSRKHFGSFTRCEGRQHSHQEMRRGSTACSAPTAPARPPRSRCCADYSLHLRPDATRGETGSLRSQAVRQQIECMSQKFSLYDDRASKKTWRSLLASMAFLAPSARPGVIGPCRSRDLRARRSWSRESAGVESSASLSAPPSCTSPSSS
jgi:ABC-2 type transport system ATP-binding protein